MLFFLVWGGLTYFWSFAPSSTVTSIYTFVQLFTLVWLIWEFAQTRREQLLLLRAYSLGSIVSSVGTLTGFFQGTGPQSGRYSGLGFNPGDLAFILALAIPISLYLAVQERNKILMWVDGAATALAFCAIVLTASRGPLIACTPTLLMFPFLFPKLRWGRNIVLLIFLALAGIGSWLFMPERSWSRLSTIGTEITSGTLNERTMIWQVGWQVFGQAPFQGGGTHAGFGFQRRQSGYRRRGRSSRRAQHFLFDFGGARGNRFRPLFRSATYAGSLRLETSQGGSGLLVMYPAHLGHWRFRPDVGGTQTNVVYFRLAHCCGSRKARARSTRRMETRAARLPRRILSASSSIC
jgi:hypothetical protein